MMAEQLGQSEGILPDAAARCHYSLVKLNIVPLRFPAEPHGGCSIRITLKIRSGQWLWNR